MCSFVVRLQLESSCSTAVPVELICREGYEDVHQTQLTVEMKRQLNAHATHKAARIQPRWHEEVDIGKGVCFVLKSRVQASCYYRTAVLL